MILLNTKIWEATVSEAKAKAANSPAWLRAIDKADQQLRRFTAVYWSFDSTKSELRLMSASNDERLYVIGAKAEEHTCPAISGGRKACYHLAAHRLLCRYVERLEQTPYEGNKNTPQTRQQQTVAQM